MNMALRTFAPIATEHLQCARYSLGTRVPRHVEKSIEYRADYLYVNLVCEYFCWMLRDPLSFFGRSLPFLILSTLLKAKTSVRGKFQLFLVYYSNGLECWYMNTGVRDLRSCIFSSFFASYDAMNEYCGDRNVYRKLSTVDRNET